MRSLTSDYSALLLINDRLDIALACRADGVHLGGHSLPADVARTILGPERLIGVSTHSPEEIRTAAHLGADFTTFGPVYATPSKAPLRHPQGARRVAGSMLQRASSRLRPGRHQTREPERRPVCRCRRGCPDLGDIGAG